MKIRDIILVLTAGLGLALILVAIVLLRGELSKLEIAQRLQTSNAVREQLLVASTALARERTDTFIQLAASASSENFGEPAAALRTHADQALARAIFELQGGKALLPRAAESMSGLVSAEERLIALRNQVDEAARNKDEQVRRAAASDWLAGVTALMDDLQAWRLDLLNDNRPTDPILAAEANIRAFVDILHGAVAFNEAIGVALLTSRGEARDEQVVTIERMVGRMNLAWQMIGNEVDLSLSEEVRAAVASARRIYFQTYDPVLLGLVNAAPNITTSTMIAAWTRTSEHSLDALGNLQNTVLKSSRERLDLIVSQAQRSGAIVTLVTVFGALAAVLILLVVRRRVINPIARISHAMERLADNDLSTPAPRAGRLDEVGVMTNALRTFKANAIKRQRTQRELAEVHQNLQRTYDQLRNDLEAAATIQMAMLPTPAIVRGVSHHGLYSPSSHIAGDTYNVVEHPDGGVGFFQIDVAGHGAAAALVSVAGQHTLSQAMLTRARETQIEDIVARINREWPENLPYFTTVLGEIDPAAPVGRIVQAGHPSPLLIRSEGNVEQIGSSGFPVGMLPQACYESIEFPFRAGDRLLIYSDGVVETESPSGDFYSESQLFDLVSAHVASATPELLVALQASLDAWRGSRELTDDVSVLIVERTKTRSNHAIH
ncbi:PP2C family protein-serine/threonine phosphatase [Devosia submarina]|uniref:PP2C family protein-serine/threonine phosphatase n=1 Tax=Devosia submarina TaxID=1173082 RepID=UPI000D3B9912|nr:SpoIIE family protein phosphatase [Devosia submarina]